MLELNSSSSVLVLGLGISGLSMARWCLRQGAAVTAADTRTVPSHAAQLQEESPGTRQLLGVSWQADLLHTPEGQVPYTAVLISPGIAPQDLAPLLAAARERGLWVGGELSLFAQALGALGRTEGYVPAVIAITGTNGKTTTTALTGQLVERAGRRVAVAGNIGPALLDTLAQHLDAQALEKLPEVWVLELSSFQLEFSEGFEPTVAAVLNVTQDHLDWHGGMSAYAGAKAKIFGRHATMVLNRDDATVMAMQPTPVAAGARQKAQAAPERQVLTFGADAPLAHGDFGIVEIHGMAWLVRAWPQDETRRQRKDDKEGESELHLQHLMPADALRIRGRHNACNALAALALATSIDCPLAPMLYGLREYRGEPHRVEPVGIVDEVEYFDDSKGTNVGATVAALEGLGRERALVVILGGDGKGQDFAPLKSPVSRYVRAVVLIGRDAPLIAEALAQVRVPLVHASTMEQAVRMAAEQAQAGDAVLLSPACASLDMYRDYAHRAQVFCQAVQDLSDEPLSRRRADALSREHSPEQAHAHEQGGPA